MTDHESEARRRFAAITDQPERRWTIQHTPQPDCWYDWFDPETGRYGQCMMKADGKWHQDPRGQQPVVLRYHNPRDRKTKASKAKDEDAS